MFMPPVFPAHWHVSQPVLIADTFSSLVWKVSLPDGTPAIVKGLKPIEDIADELRGADYLVWRNGRGAVRLLGRENNLMLLEYAGERMLSHIVAEHGDYQATEIAAELMAKLYAASEEPRQPDGCKLKTAPVRPVVAARPATYVCSEGLFY
ncbi:streptomycin phosphotransferase [Escherichia coli]|nr:streptomycin phosphotransferase [Escherichia coli]CTW80063.1 streptomycin phosphotransferase [Escherichia coli]